MALICPDCGEDAFADAVAFDDRYYCRPCADFRLQRGIFAPVSPPTKPTKPPWRERAWDWLQRALGRSDVYAPGDGLPSVLYMKRWRLIHRKWFGVRIHHIVRSDGDRELHDHPFSFVSFILKGGYWEWRAVERTQECSRCEGCGSVRTQGDERNQREFNRCPHCFGRGVVAVVDPHNPELRWVGAGRVVFRRAETLHRLVLKERTDHDDDLVPTPAGTWTFVITGPRRREWGFATKEGWVDWKTFTAEREGQGAAAGKFSSESSI